jgi:hypothetical protein
MQEEVTTTGTGAENYQDSWRCWENGTNVPSWSLLWARVGECQQVTSGPYAEPCQVTIQGQSGSHKDAAIPRAAVLQQKKPHGSFQPDGMWIGCQVTSCSMAPLTGG